MILKDNQTITTFCVSGVWEICSCYFYVDILSGLKDTGPWKTGVSFLFEYI